MTNKVALKVLEQQISSFEPGMHLGCIFHNEEEFLLSPREGLWSAENMWRHELGPYGDGRFRKNFRV